MPSAFAGLFRLVAREVDEIDWARPGKEVDSGQEDEKRGAENDGYEVEAEMVPEVMEVMEGEGGDLGGDDDHEWGEKEVHAMGDEVVVAKLNVLEPHRLQEVREPP